MNETQTTRKDEMTRLSSTNTGRFSQETYETASRNAAKRSRQLRRLGYQVAVGPMGPQVTPLGIVKMTMVHILPGSNADTFCLPEVVDFEWPRH